MHHYKKRPPARPNEHFKQIPQVYQLYNMLSSYLYQFYFILNLINIQIIINYSPSSDYQSVPGKCPFPDI